MSNTIPSCYVLLVFFHLWSIQIQFDCYRELRNCPGFCFFSLKTNPIGGNKGFINVSLTINSQNFYVCLPEWIAYNFICLWSPMLMMKRLKCINLSECLFVWYLYVYLYGTFFITGLIVTKHCRTYQFHCSLSQEWRIYMLTSIEGLRTGKQIGKSCVSKQSAFAHDLLPLSLWYH